MDDASKTPFYGQGMPTVTMLRFFLSRDKTGHIICDHNSKVGTRPERDLVEKNSPSVCKLCQAVGVRATIAHHFGPKRGSKRGQNPSPLKQVPVYLDTWAGFAHLFGCSAYDSDLDAPLAETVRTHSSVTQSCLKD